VDNVTVRDIGVVFNHPGTADPANYEQVAFDFQHITRSFIINCYAGNYSKGGLIGVRTDPAAQIDAVQGIGILFGTAHAPANDYAGGEVNTAEGNQIFGARKCIVLDDAALEGGLSAAHACTIRNNDVQICESGIVQETRYAAGCYIVDNIIQAVQNMRGSSATTYCYRMNGYNGTLGGGYIETPNASLDFMLKLDTLSKRNYVYPFYYSDSAHVIQDDGDENFVSYINPTTPATFIRRFDDRNTEPGIAKAWVTFDDLGAIQQSMNVTGITNNATGDWTITMPAGLHTNSDYAFSGSGIVNASAHAGTVTGRTQSTTQLRVTTRNINNAALEDWDKTTVIIY